MVVSQQKLLIHIKVDHTSLIYDFCDQSQLLSRLTSNASVSSAELFQYNPTIHIDIFHGIIIVMLPLICRCHSMPLSQATRQAWSDSSIHAFNVVSHVSGLTHCARVRCMVSYDIDIGRISYERLFLSLFHSVIYHLRIILMLKKAFHIRSINFFTQSNFSLGVYDINCIFYWAKRESLSMSNSKKAVRRYYGLSSLNNIVCL